MTDHAVSPSVATAPDRVYGSDQHEVAEIVMLVVGDLTNRANYESERRDHSQYGEIWLHFFHVDGYIVWGTTGWILVRLLELMTDWRVPEETDRVVDPDADYPV